MGDVSDEELLLALEAIADLELNPVSEYRWYETAMPRVGAGLCSPTEVQSMFCRLAYEYHGLLQEKAKLEIENAHLHAIVGHTITLN